GQRLDILFGDVMADDIGTAQKLLAFAGLEPNAESVADMRAYMDSHPRGKDGRVVYDLAGDFNLDIAALRQRFSFYTDRFNVRQEVKS
ncbi:MAG TPA: hypothetical protein VEQ16_01720, partial [Acidocella sp.]|nr:hypothetical protein [Acidocella sp.]